MTPSARNIAIGIDVGGTKIAAHATDGTLWNMAMTTVDTPAQASSDVILDTVASAIQHVLRQTEREAHTVRAIGIGTLGQIDPVRGMIIDSNDNLAGWSGTPIVSVLSDRFNLPVYLENDVRAMAIGETALGAGVGYERILYTAVGTGIGGAIVINGKVEYGTNQSAGELGYLVTARTEQGTPLRFEQIAGGPPLERTYQIRAQHPAPISLREVAKRAYDGDQKAIDVIREGGYIVGSTLAPIVAFIDPQIVIIGGGVADIGTLWWDALNAGFDEFPLTSTRATPRIKAQLGNQAAMYGAAIYALQKWQANQAG